jgi:peptidyl-prolyl cis-trans isomerase C
MKHVLVVLAGAAALAACGVGLAQGTATPTLPPPTPTATPAPLAARVNGDGILLSDYQEEISRFEAAQAALGTDLATMPGYQDGVLQALIDRKLLAQAATGEGRSIDDAAVEAEVERLAQLRGGNEAMGAWLAENDYSLDSFKRALREDRLAATMVDQLSHTIGDSAEQVHVAQIVVATRDEAESLRTQILDGADFADLAWVNSLDAGSRPAGGDLGWSPRGYLLQPEVDAAAWSLAPGETSDVIESALGYHIVRVLERADHPLTPDARRFLRERAVQTWLADQRSTARIEILQAP